MKETHTLNHKLEPFKVLDYKLNLHAATSDGTEFFFFSWIQLNKREGQPTQVFWMIESEKS